MQVIDGTLVLGATDLAGFLACEHLTQLDRRVASGERIERADTELGRVLSRRGERHEIDYAASLRAQDRRVERVPVELSLDARSLGDLRAAEELTVRHMSAGVDVIEQASFFDGRWHGRADFLIRTDKASALGSFSYEVADAKLAMHVRGEAVLQLCEYSAQLQRLQQRVPDAFHVVLGDGSVHSYRTSDFAAYHRNVRKRVEIAVLGISPATYPEKVAHCKICRYAKVCDAQRRADDHLVFVAGIRREQIRKLKHVGITTLSELAGDGNGLRVPGVGTPTLQRLRGQARLQKEGSAGAASPAWRVLACAPNEGLGVLPEPSPLDMFLDLEGDSFARDGSLEYLFGAVTIDAGEVRYRPWWGHDPAGERASFEGFVDAAIERLDADPAMHIYHYGDYERAALQRLMGRHATREEQVDRLLRGRVLVDLHRIVRQAVQLSTESYSLKDVERLYMDRRTDEVADAGDSMVQYQRWLEDRDPRRLERIRAYNEVDCSSTLKLREWLEARRLDVQAGGVMLPRAEARDGDPPPALQSAIDATQHVRDSLTAGLPDEPERRSALQQATWLLAQLLGWHRREQRPEWWRYFGHLEMADEELAGDAEALGPLQVEGSWPVAKSQAFRYRFEPQDHRIRLGDQPIALPGGAAAGEVLAIDDITGCVDLKRGPTVAARDHPRYLIPALPRDLSNQRRALLDLGEWVAGNGIDAPGPRRAGRDLLLRGVPRLAGVERARPLQRLGESTLEAAVRLAHSLDHGCLAIQGPPGSGKTYTAARVVISLIASGRRVGVTAQSHRAIGNLLDEISRAAHELGRPVAIMQKAPAGARCGAADICCTDTNEAVEAALEDGTVDVVGGTPWLFARPRLQNRLDTLVVDEAGQVSLADAVVVSGAARNLILVGDPRQLPQVVTGSHPDGAQLSALEHMLGDDLTIRPERGLFLESTRRMHPEICAFVSGMFYEGRLRADPCCARQAILVDETGGELAGIRTVSIAHQGNSRRSGEEVAAVVDLVRRLSGRRWRDPGGRIRALGLDDILVIAPYNSQVGALAAALPHGARVGTVDRFQGQEAVVSIFTMATSSAEDMPRNIEFLFSLNRLNVAISRARCLSILVCSPTLLTTIAGTPERVRLVNALCRYAELAPEGLALP